LIIDVSLILCLHREGKYLLRTLRSLKEAASFARAEGIRTELIAVLDRADGLTRTIVHEFDLEAFDNSEILEVDNGSLGPSRNDGCAYAQGKYLMLCDGDDLVSFNYISKLFLEAERSGPKAIIVPGWVMDFGEHYCVTQYSGLEDVTPLAFLDVHPYTSRTFFHRGLYDILRFSDVRLTTGYAYEDWHFNANAVGLGYTFHVASDAILFYRIRSGSLLRQADRLSVKQIPPSVLFEPETYLRVCSQSVERLRSGNRPKPRLRGKGRLNDPTCQLLIAAANRIEPKIEPKYLQDGLVWFPAKASNLKIGQAYFDVCCRLVGLRFAHVFLFPNFGVGGAERYFSNVIATIHARRPGKKILVLLGEAHEDNAWLGRLQAKATVIDLAAYRAAIGAEGIDLVALKLIQSCAPDGTVHIRQSSFGQRFFDKFGRALESNKFYFYYFCEEIRPRGDFGFAQPWSFSFVSENFEHLDGVVSDNRHIARADYERIGVSADKWKFLPTMHNPPISRAEAVARAMRPANRLLWASRLSWQKRPGMIRTIALRLREVRPDLAMDIYGGHPVEFDSALLGGLPNVSCHGPYGSFPDSVESPHFCFLYTSLFDGIPTVLLEAAGLGLPIIAPDVPAINEFVEDGKTGLLLESLIDDEEMARSYVRAIVQMADDANMRGRLAGAAYDQVMRVHSTEPYTAALMELLGGKDEHRAA
jgi:glycosyltransferase involved in cell wall biosynthesis